MSLSNFFLTCPGMYVIQSFLHSLIAAVIVDRAIEIWQIRCPVMGQRFRLIVVIFPIFSLPIFQIISPERGSISFRLTTLIDTDRWLYLEVLGRVPLSVFFVLLLLITTLVFLFQEMAPVLRQVLKSGDPGPPQRNADDFPVVKNALVGFPAPKPDVFVMEDDGLSLFSTSGAGGAIHLSKGLVEALNEEEMRSAIAHEVAHMKRSKRPLLVFAFVFRIVMFFNPVVLVEFRRVVQEEEKICDDLAVALTRNPRALVETLKKFHGVPQDGESEPRRLKDLQKSLEEYGHRLHIESRIRRLEEEDDPIPGEAKYQLLLTLIVVALTSYFVV